MRHRVAWAALVALAALTACKKESDRSLPVEETPAPATASPATPPDLERAAFPVLVWSAWAVEQEYFDPSRFSPAEQVVWGARFLGLHTPEFFAEPTDDLLQVNVKVRAATKAFDLRGLSTLSAAAARLEDILEFTQSVLKLDEPEKHELEYVAINGFFSVLDPHTILLTPEEHAELGVRTRGEFAGVGAEIRAEARRIRIVRVIEGGPAAAAGLRAGDLIVRIDDESTVNMTSREAQQLLRGLADTLVRIVVRRGDALLPFRVTRGVIHIPSVEAVALPGPVAYLRVSTFQENTGEQVAAALERLAQREPLQGVVLDLRGNSGGLLTQAMAVLDRFVDQGELVVVHSALGRESQSARPEVAIPITVPVVALIDESAASASEIVAGGLQALGRGVVVGRRSFGKGTVQMLKPATPYGRELALKLTVAEYRVAGEGTIQGVGVEPDLGFLPIELSDIPGLARYYDLQRFEQSRERSRTAYLPSARPTSDLVSGPDEPYVRYVWNVEQPDGGDDEPEEMRDPEIRLAHRVTKDLLAPQPGSTWHERMAGIAQRLALAEDARTVKILRGRFGIDWTRAALGAIAPALTVDASLGSKSVVSAGKPFSLQISVENTSNTVAKRVHVVTRCTHEELDGIELLVGAIAPGAKVRRSLELQVLPWRASFVDVLELEVWAGEQGPIARTRVALETKAPARPSLLVDHWIVDDPRLAESAPARPPLDPLPGEDEFVVAGNGDGILQRGERVLLAFVVRNDGSGPGEQTYAMLRNLSGEQGLLEEGTMMIGPLAPTKSASGAFALTVNDDADPRLPMDLELVVGDARVREVVSEQLQLRVLDHAPRWQPGAQVGAVGKDGARVYNGGHASATVIGHLVPDSPATITGTIGGWAVLDAAVTGRRLFVPADLLEALRPVQSREPMEPDLHFAVVPPRIELLPVDARTTGSTVKVEGKATHADRVRDLMISVLPPGQARLARKVYYVAGSSSGADAAGTLSFSTVVPLEPGSNHLTVVARDGARVEGRVDLWVYREPRAVAEVIPSESPSKPKSKPEPESSTPVVPAP